jgi:hypothetical protein
MFGLELINGDRSIMPADRTAASTIFRQHASMRLLTQDSEHGHWVYTYKHLKESINRHGHKLACNSLIEVYPDGTYIFTQAHTTKPQMGSQSSVSMISLLLPRPLAKLRWPSWT